LEKINQRKTKKQIEERNRELQIILDSIPAWIFYKDKENRFIKVNEAFCKVMGKTKKELEGKSLFDIYPKKQAEAFLKDDLEIIESAKPKRNIVEQMNSAKGELWIKTDKIPYTDENNNIIGIIGFALDVTDQIQIEKNLENAKIAAKNVLEDLSIEKSKLETARAKEKAILLSIGDGLIATDEKGNIIFLNKTAEKLLGTKNEKVAGKNFSEVIFVEDEKGIFLPLEKRHINKVLITGEPAFITTAGPTYYYVRSDKTKFPVATTITPVVLDKKVIGVIEVFRDITQEKEIDKAKSEFISLASHQLKTPPTAIKMLTERLLGGKMGELEKKQKEYLTDIRYSNQRMIDLVNALLNVSRIELGAFIIQVNEKDAGCIVQSIIDELKSVIDKKQLKFKIISPKKNIMLMLDEPLFRIIISNLIINAVNYTEQGGEIQLEYKIMDKGQMLGEKLLEENYFTVIISDKGYGIPQYQQDKVFTKFFRGDNAREKHTDGTGLGLYIVKSILDNSGGLIWFVSNENKGSTFYIAIPMAGMKVKTGGKELIC
jgi:PAS domain S-box-containing protein